MHSILMHRSLKFCKRDDRVCVITPFAREGSEKLHFVRMKETRNVMAHKKKM